MRKFHLLKDVDLAHVSDRPVCVVTFPERDVMTDDGRRLRASAAIRYADERGVEYQPCDANGKALTSALVAIPEAIEAERVRGF